MKKVAIALLLLAFSGCGGDESAPGSAAPLNVVVITLDTLRADALGAYGQERPASPRIDAMAADGLLFEHVVTSAPSTFPSHSSLFTGKEPYAHGVRSNLGYALADDNVTLAEILKSRGYVTGAQVAAPVIGRERNLSQGFDTYVDPGETETVLEKLAAAETGRNRLVRSAEEITEGGLAFLRENANRPFLLWLHYFDIHRPHEPPKPFLTRIPDSPYHAEVARVDHGVGRIVDAIEELGIRDHTLVVVTSDHGEGMGEHGEDSHSFFVYDSTMRIPLVMWGAGVVPRGARASTLVRLVDVMPTVLDLIDAPHPPAMQGTSLKSLFADPSRDLALIGYGESVEPATNFGSSTLRFVREGRWKYIHKENPELFDLTADPHELQNLAETHPEVLDRMRDRLWALIEAAPAKPAGAEVAMDASTLQQLHALGYVGGPALDQTGDEIDLLEIQGPDPTTRIGDVAQMAYAMGFLVNGKFVEAEEILRRIVERNPKSTSALRYLIAAIHRQDRREEIVPLYRRLIELDPDHLEAKGSFASVLQSLGRDDEAEVLFRDALALDACDVRARLFFSELLRSNGRFEEQIAVLEEGSADCANSKITRNALAYALATSPQDGLRDGERALALAEAVVAETEGTHPDYLDTLACAHAELGQFDEAVDLVDQAIAKVEGHDVPKIMETFREHRERFVAGEPVRETETSDAAGEGAG